MGSARTSAAIGGAAARPAPLSTTLAGTSEAVVVGGGGDSAPGEAGLAIAVSAGEMTASSGETGILGIEVAPAAVDCSVVVAGVVVSEGFAGERLCVFSGLFATDGDAFLPCFSIVFVDSRSFGRSEKLLALKSGRQASTSTISSTSTAIGTRMLAALDQAEAAGGAGAKLFPVPPNPASPSSSATAVISPINSRGDCCRCVGRLASIFSSRRMICGEISGRNRRGSGGSSPLCQSSFCSAVPSGKGGRPDTM